MAMKKKKARNADWNSDRRQKFGKRLKKLRTDLGYSNGLDFSVDFKINYSVYARWEAGKSNITYDNLCMLADIFKMPLAKLLEGI